MTDLAELKLFATKPHPCSYLEDQEATTLFVDPNAELNGDIYSQLSEFGFRRSGSHVYRPRCQHCNACIPIRVPVNAFTPSKSQKRCIKTNRDLDIVPVTDISSDEHYELYAKYIELRHRDGDMYPPSKEQYEDFLTAEWGITQFLEFRKDDRLIAVSVVDKVDNGLSAIYAYFDPEEEKRSLGAFNILHLIDRACSLDVPYLYLGYWIKDCQKMRYKVLYRPFQILIESHWVTVNDFKPTQNSTD